jgi:hypothetical protein
MFSKTAEPPDNLPSVVLGAEGVEGKLLDLSDESPLTRAGTDFGEWSRAESSN